MNIRRTSLSVLATLALSLPLISQAKTSEVTVHVDAALDRPVVPAERDQNVVVQIKLTPEVIAGPVERPPVNLSILLDRSGSMGGEKIRQAILAAEEALYHLGPQDIVSVVIYDDQVQTLAPAQRATRENIAQIRSMLREVQAGGSTAIYAGLNQAAAEVRRNRDLAGVNRIVLLSDGLANAGPSGVGDFAALGRAFASEDIVVSTVGLGLGFNEDIMATLAEAGQGNTYFVENARDLPRIFAGELGDALNVAATDIEIIIHTKGGAKIIRGLGREAEIDGDTACFRLPQVYGGADKLALLEIQAPAGVAGDARELVEVEVNYLPVGSSAKRQQSVTVPIAYTEREEEVKEAARVDIAQNVADNVIAESKQEAIKFADAGDKDAAAQRMLSGNTYIYDNYGMLGDEFLQAPAAELEAEAKKLEQDGMSNETRKAYRAESYQTTNQQSTSK